MPVGFLISSLTLLSWRVFPGFFPDHWSSRFKLALQIFLSLCVWSCLSLSFLFGMQTLRNQTRFAYINVMWCGVGAFCIQVFIGIFLLFTTTTLSQKVNNKITLKVTLLRGILAFSSVFTSVCLTLVDEAAAAFAATFPAIFTTVMISMSLSHDPSVVKGAIVPMILGSLSPAVFCFAYYGVYILLEPVFPDNEIAVIALGASIAYVVSIFTMSLPMTLLVKCRRKMVVAVVDDSWVPDEESDLLKDSNDTNNNGFQRY